MFPTRRLSPGHLIDDVRRPHLPGHIWTVLIGFVVGLTAATPRSLHGQDLTQVHRLESAPTPVDNPLKGLVPYSRPTPGRFPHSMEFNYVGLGRLVIDEKRYDWTALETLLDDIASRGNQTVLRIYMEYPKKDDGIPKYLRDLGVKITRWKNTNTAPFPPAICFTPNYEDARVRAMLTDFIAAFGKRYDGDARLGYVTAGLLGTWGEWHTYPRDDLFASKQTQAMVMDAYQAAFKKTPVLLRYPAGDDHYAQAENASRPFGYHDDSFAWATLDTGRAEDDWFFVPALKDAGTPAIEKWKRSPIGGEIRPELWGSIFDGPDAQHEQAQDFRQCVTQTHATWLLDTGMSREAPSAERRKNATEAVRPMGYDLTVTSFAWQLGDDGTLEVSMGVQNRGVAPFYADWPSELGIVDQNGRLTWKKTAPSLSVKGLLPSPRPHVLRASFRDGTPDPAHFVFRVVQPLENGKPLRFGNQTQDAHLPGWLTVYSRR